MTSYAGCIGGYSKLTWNPGERRANFDAKKLKVQDAALLLQRTSDRVNHQKNLYGPYLQPMLVDLFRGISPSQMVQLSDTGLAD